MSITSITYQRKLTGDKFQRDCCPADGIARASRPKSHEKCQEWLLPASKKIVVDVSQDDYVVPEILVDQIRFIVGTSAGTDPVLVSINMLCLNDEGADVVQVQAGIEAHYQPTIIYAAGTTASRVIIGF